MNKQLLLCLCFLVMISSAAFAKKDYRVLVFSKTSGFHHDAIPDGIAAIEKLGKDNGFAVDTTTDSTKFNPANLKKYSAVIFLSTTMNVLGDAEQAAFEKYIQSGGGYVGVHAATDTEYDWPWYNKLVGAQFKSHPKQQDAVLDVVDSTFIATKHLPRTWKRWDEWYNFKSMQLDNNVHILIKIDESSYQGGENGSFHPMSWYHEFDGGRAFYTELGHTKESYADPLYLQHLLGGIDYAMDKKK